MATEECEEFDACRATLAALLECTDSIAERWLEDVKRDVEVPSSETIPEPQLMDSVPELLKQVVAVASGEARSIEADRLDCAEKHGRERADADFDPSELVREYQVLRHVVFRDLQRIVSERGITAAVAVRACRSVGAALDEALRATISAFVEEQTDDLVQKSRRDSLTGLLNHRSFYDELSRELKVCERTGRCLAVAILDLDRFKEVNDELGHRVGDRLVVAWAEKLSQRLRESDIVSRYGGDEFAAILPNADRKSAESLIRGLAVEPVRLADLGLRATEGFKRSVVRISWGVAESPADGTSAVDLVETADARLRRAKRHPDKKKRSTRA